MSYSNRERPVRVLLFIAGIAVGVVVGIPILALWAGLQ